MSIQIKAPTFPESVQDGTLTKINKQAGDIVESNEIIASLEALDNTVTPIASKTQAGGSADGVQKA